MTYVITEPCIGTKDNSCVEVCPVDCIHPTPDEPGYEQAEQLYIDPEECIDCDACVEACPSTRSSPRIRSRGNGGTSRAQRRVLPFPGGVTMGDNPTLADTFGSSVGLAPV